ncbi:unnamed protein product [Merluccius merluccius]
MFTTWDSEACEERRGQSVRQRTAGVDSPDGGRHPYTSPPTRDSEREVQTFTTVPPVNAPNHRHVLEGPLLPERLLMRDFQGDQRYLSRNGGGPLMPRPTAPGSLAVPEAGGEAGGHATQTAAHEDVPAFSDVASPAATSPATTTTTGFPGLAFTTLKPPLAAIPPTTATTKVDSSGSSRALEKDAARSGGKGAVNTDGDRPTSSSSGSSVSPGGAGAPAFTALASPPGKTDSEDSGEKSKTISGQEVLRQPVGKDRTTTTPITTTTTTTTMQTGPCSLNFTDPEGTIEIREWPRSEEECDYLVTVYLGYGIELQVLNASLLGGEVLSLEDTGGPGPSLLANESVLMRGLVVRSRSNQISIRFRSDRDQGSGSLLLRYQAFVLSCALPRRPPGGDVSVSRLQAGGEAFFVCASGYRLLGPEVLTCRNATTPYWSGKEPTCIVSCGGMMKNATHGRIVSPGFPGNYSNNLTCHWVLEAPEGQRLHVHFEKVALAEDDDRLLIKNGNNIDSPAVYDSYEVEYLPNEGVLSTGRHLFIEFTTDGTLTSTGAAIRYEAFAKGTCYEPFVKYGNFSGSDPGYGVGTVVEFSCNPGYTLEQGSVVIECVDAQNPQWNDTEPACRAVCSGEMTDSAGVVLSPNWPEVYDKGQDCIWGVHVEEDKRIMLDIQVLNLGKNDLLTFYDGDDLTANILGQYGGTRPHFKLFTSMADVTVQFQSDPATNIYGYNNGFVVHFFEVARNDTCSELPEITNGWKSTSHPDLIHGTVVTYQCYPGYELAGAEVLMCQWDLTWSGDVPRCDQVLTCQDPGSVDHSRKTVTGQRFSVGATVQFVCQKGYVLAGSGLLTCYNRDTAKPKWSDRLPKCLPERYEPCRNPGAPSTSVQSSEKAFYQAGESLSFSCHTGYELQGEPAIYCVPGHPSQWNSTPPACKASTTQYVNERRLDVVSSDYDLEGSNIALAVFVPAVVILFAVLAVYVYFTKLQGKSVSMPSSLPPYDNMTEESAFDNPVYERGVSTEGMNLQDVASHNTSVLS